ncbi:hypothetical protein ACFY12_21420 [Streptomyces sp. NPDC001339]|uniref:hypothetical protein n=1 Tax=Streptomyces sp. NPDC001339 TaxID=3364563 RepID=UPI003674FCAB
MKTLRRTLVAGAAVLALGGVAAPAASANTINQAAPASGVAVMKTWHATVQCQIIRISDNNAIGYERADGTGNTKEKAIIDAERNIPVPQGHYKRHCDAKRTW